MTSPKLEADLRGKILSLKLTNNSNRAIKVDRELVFLVTVAPVDSENQAVSVREVHALPLPDKKEVMARFVWLQPGKSVERKIEITKPFKEFIWGYSDKMAISAYERLVILPQNDVVELHISYGIGHLMREALESYIGMWPKDLYEGPLTYSVDVRGKDK